MVRMAALLALASAQEPGFAPGVERPPLPPMGWRSWNWFRCNIDQETMEAQATAMAAVPTWASKSLRDLGYDRIGLDDCWQSCTGPQGSFHDEAGNPIVNTTSFPSLSGMAAQAVSLGLKPGFYGNNCRCHQGEVKVGIEHYVEDVQLTLDSGFAGTKIDSCGNQRDMTKYAQELATRNASLLVENCGNGPAGANPKMDFPPHQDYLDMLQTSCPWSFYRTSVDVAPQFYSTVYNVNRALPFLDADAPLSRPGCWAYPDMLMVGVDQPHNGGEIPVPMSYLDWSSHFALWAVTSSPLILGFDLTNKTVLEMVWPIIANEEVLAVSQSWAGHPGRLVANSSSIKDVGVEHHSTGNLVTQEAFPSWQLWAKPLPGGATAALLVRHWAAEGEGSLTFPLSKLFSGSPPGAVSVRDVLAHTDKGTADTSVKFELGDLPEHGAAFVVLTPAKAAVSV